MRGRGRDRKDYYDDEKIPEMKLTDTTDSIIKNAEIEILKINFADFSNWEFRYNGERVLAQILDNNFIQKVNNSTYGFAISDKLFADIRIESEVHPKKIDVEKVREVKLKYKDSND